MIDHGDFPAISTARLPNVYTAAKIALAECSRLDECKDWADKAMALSSYARQADDKEMERTAMRIRARACRRCGQLLKEIEKGSGGDRRSEDFKEGGAPHFETRKQAAEDAGMSPDQAKQSIRIANVPDHDFEKQVESAEPPTTTKLAEQGINRRGKFESPGEVFLRSGMTKEAFQAGMHLPGALERLVNDMKQYDPQDVADGTRPKDRPKLRKTIAAIDAYLDQLVVKL